MYRFIILISVSFFVTDTNLTPIKDHHKHFTQKIQLRIRGGKPATRNQFPYQAGLALPLNESTAEVCGGALISRRVILTAAHCVHLLDENGSKNQLAKQIYVFLGMFKNFDINEIDQLQFIIQQQNIISYPMYDSATNFHDIAIIKLPEEISLTRHIQVINLPPINQDPDSLIGLDVLSSGWGRVGNKGRPKELQYIVTKIVPSLHCVNPHHNVFHEKEQICVNAPNKSLCKGDSGGPNVITTSEGKKILIGITSHLAYDTTCEAGIPQVLARVSFYLPWIHNHTGIPI